MTAVVAETDVADVVPPPLFPHKSLADVLRELGGVPAHRVRLYPYPGTATEADLLANPRCELVSGTLVEKPMGAPESFLAGALVTFLNMYVFPRRLGLTTVPDGPFRMSRGNTREPDVSFTRRERLPNPIPQVGGWCPDLCVEVLSPDNTRAEMAMKRAEYFASGCRLVWIIDPATRAADVYTAPETFTHLDESGTLGGGDVLPGFALSLRDLFAELDALSTPPAP